MDLLQLLILLVISGLCAAFVEFLLGYTPGGLLLSIIIGVIGAYIGSPLRQLFSPLPIRVGDVTLDLLWTILGSALLLLLIYAIRQREVFGRRF